MSVESMKKQDKTLRKTLNEILKIDREELYGEKRLHDISFNHHGKEQFEMVFGLIEDISKCHFDRIPENFTSSILQQLEVYQGIIERAKNLNLTDDSSPRISRDQIVQELEDSYQNLFNAAVPIINFANQTGMDFKQIEKEARQSLELVKTQAEEEDKWIKSRKQDADRILEAMRSASAKGGSVPKCYSLFKCSKGS